MKLSSLAKAEWITALLAGTMLTFGVIAIEFWWLAFITVPLTLFTVTFFRDPDRTPPTQRGVIVAPADGRVISIHDVKNFKPFDGKTAVCVRIFLSIFNVHVQRSPCHGRVLSVTHKAGKHINVLNPASVEQNEAVLMVLQHPVKEQPVAAVRQIAGSFARTIVCAVKEGQVLQRAQRFGVIKLGSTVELYLPKDTVTRMSTGKGQKVIAGSTVLAEIAQSSKAIPAKNTSEISKRTSEPKAEPTPIDAVSTIQEDTVQPDEQLTWEEQAVSQEASENIPEETQAVLDTLTKNNTESNDLQQNSASEFQEENQQAISSEHATDLTDDEAYEYEEVEEEEDDDSEIEAEESFEYIYVDEDGNEIPEEEVDTEEASDISDESYDSAETETGSNQAVEKNTPNRKTKIDSLPSIQAQEVTTEKTKVVTQTNKSNGKKLAAGSENKDLGPLFVAAESDNKQVAQISETDNSKLPQADQTKGKPTY